MTLRDGAPTSQEGAQTTQHRAEPALAQHSGSTIKLPQNPPYIYRHTAPGGSRPSALTSSRSSLFSRWWGSPSPPPAEAPELAVTTPSLPPTPSQPTPGLSVQLMSRLLSRTLPSPTHHRWAPDWPRLCSNHRAASFLTPSPMGPPPPTHQHLSSCLTPPPRPRPTRTPGQPKPPRGLGRSFGFCSPIQVTASRKSSRALVPPGSHLWRLPLCPQCPCLTPSRQGLLGSSSFSLFSHVHMGLSSAS